MSVASKLIGIWMFKRTVSSTTPLLMRLLLGMAALTVSAVILAILGAAIVFGLLWVAYEQLVTNGVPPHNAELIIGGVVLALFAYTLGLVQSHWRSMRKVANSIIYMQAPISGKLSTLADAFMDGYEHPNLAARGR